VVFAEVVVSGRLKNIFAYLLAATVVVACGTSTETKTPPVPVNPTTQTGGDGTTTLPPSGSLDPRIAEFTKTVALLLTDFTNFTGLSEVAFPDVIYPVINDNGDKELVGDGSRIQILIPNTRSATFNGSKLLIAAEDAKGLWWLKMKQFAGTGFQSGSSFDVIFADDILVVRIDAQIVSGNNVNATVKYRRRVSGDEQCKPVTRTGCDALQAYPYWYNFYGCNVLSIPLRLAKTT
jgi:hypothetical protein